MNKLNATRSFLTALVVASAVALAACGGGSSDTGGLKAGTAVGTKGDGITQIEYDSIKKGMTREQVIAIVGDGPTFDAGIVLAWRNSDGTTSEVLFDSTGGAIEKTILSADGKTYLQKVTL